MRKDVKKMLFIGLSADRKRFFEEAQDLGTVHFLDAVGDGTREKPADLEHLLRALKILRGLPTTEQEEIDDFDRCDAIVEALLACHTAFEQNLEHQRLTRLEIARVEPFGAFSRSDLAYIERVSGRRMHFYWAKVGAFTEEDLSAEVAPVATSHGVDYFVSFTRAAVRDGKLTEMQVEKPVQELREYARRLEKEDHELNTRLKGYAKYSAFLHRALADKLNRYHLHTAESYPEIALDGYAFAVEGWVPENKLDTLHTLANKLDIHVEEIAPNADEVAPTYLENQGPARIGEDLVNIYDVPANTDVDPSLWVLCFFALFFAIIINDAGYGLIFLAAALYLRWRNAKMTLAGKRLWKLALLLAGACTLWGVFTHSYFGISLSVENPLTSYSLMHSLVTKKVAYLAAHNPADLGEWQVRYPELKIDMPPQAMLLAAAGTGHNGNLAYELYDKMADGIFMELALAIGVVHIILSLMRYLRRNWANAGWIALIIGGYLYFPTYLHATSMWQYLGGISYADAGRQGLILMAGGMVIATLLSIWRYGAKGIFEIMVATQIFGDILSYLRLYALGVAGAIVGATVNDMAGMVGLVSGGLILLMGHLFNIVLSIMGGVIHGLRLNFLEWYHYSFEGGGKPFRPLEKLNVEIE